MPACSGARQLTKSLAPFFARQFSILKTLLACVSFDMTVFFLMLSCNAELVFALVLAFALAAERFALLALGRA